MASQQKDTHFVLTCNPHCSQGGGSFAFNYLPCRLSLLAKEGSFTALPLPREEALSSPS